MSSSMGRISLYIMENKIHVWNHQPANILASMFPELINRQCSCSDCSYGFMIVYGIWTTYGLLYHMARVLSASWNHNIPTSTSYIYTIKSLKHIKTCIYIYIYTWIFPPCLFLDPGLRAWNSQPQELFQTLGSISDPGYLWISSKIVFVDRSWNGKPIPEMTQCELVGPEQHVQARWFHRPCQKCHE